MSDTERLYRQNAAKTAAGMEIDAGLRSYMLGVYNYMAMGIAATALVGLFFILNPQLVGMFVGPVKFIPFIGILALGFFAPKMIFNGSSQMAHGAYWLYVGLWGLLIGPVVAVYTNSLGMGAEVVKAFFITATMFAAMSLYGYTAKRDLSGWGKFLFMAGVGFLIAIVVNIFIGSSLMSFLISGGVVLLMAALTAYETQMIKNMYYEGSTEMNKRASIFGAFALYGSFVTMFIHVLNLLGMTRD